MTQEKVGFLRMEDCTVEELHQVQETVEDELPENYNIVAMDENIAWADPREMMEMFLTMFNFIEAECFNDQAEAHRAVNKDQRNLKNAEEKYQ